MDSRLLISGMTDERLPPPIACLHKQTLGVAMTGKLDESSNYVLAMTREKLLDLTLFYFNDIVLV